MNFVRKHFPLMVLALALLVIGGGTLTSYLRSADKPRVVSAEISYVADFSDSRVLAGFADNVFIGRVLKQDQTHTPDGTIPETLFSVEVIHSLKGSLSGTVMVNQQGGFSEEDNAIILMEEDQLLEAGNTYLLATKEGGNGQWHTLVPRYGDLRMNNDRERADLVRKFEKAVKEQIPLPQ